MTGQFKKLRIGTAMVLVVLMVVLIPVQAGAIVLPEMTVSENQISGTQDGAIDAQEEETKPAKILAEVTEDRDEYTKHFRMDDGSFMAVQYEYPVHYQDKNGEWVDYDNSMKEVDTQLATDTPTEPEEPASSTEPAPSATEEQTASAASNDASAATAAVSETEAASIEAKEAETETATDAAEPASLDSDEKTEYKNKKSDLDIRLSKKAKKNNMVKIKGDGYQVSWGFAGVNKSRVEFISNDEKLEGNDKFLVRKNLVQEALYKNAFPNVDLQYLVTPVGVKENIILKNKDAQTEFEIAYKIKGLTAEKKNDFTIVLKDKDGKAVYEIYAPFMTDAKGEKSTQLQMEIKNQKTNKLTVVLSADKEWLAGTKREYPVTIDPSFNTSNAWQNTACSYVDQSHPTTAYGYGSESGYTGTVYAGTLGGSKNYRTYLKMNSLPKLNKGDMIVEAYLNMYLYQSSFYTDMYVGAYHVSESWKQSTVTWNNKPNCESMTEDYEKLYKGIGIDDSPWVNWDVTKSVKRWYNGEANYGIMLKPVDEATNAQCASFYSSNFPDAANPRPVFSIIYRNNKGLEDYWTYTSFNVGTAGTAYINDYTGNLVFVHNDSSTAGERMPVNVQHVYNNYMAGVKYAKTTPYVGRGWRLNYQQTLLPSSQFGLKGKAAETYPYVYTDGDGTDHYIYKKTENGKTTYQDEDNLKLTLTINTSSTYARYKLTDDKDNFMEFDTSGRLRKIIDANGNYLTVKFSTAAGQENKIVAIRDGAIENNVAKQVAFIETASGTEYVSQMRDPAGRLTTFYYTDGTLNQIKNPDGTSIYFTYDDDGSITSVKDIDGYTVRFGYSSLASGKQVTNVVEYGTDGTVGQRVTFDRTKYNTTVVHSSGNDGVYSNDDKADDLYTTMQFDNWGRTTSIKSKTGQKDLGAAGCQYTSGSPNSDGSNLNQINRVTNEYNLGSNAINLLVNHNMEASGTWKTGAWGGTNSFTTAYTTEQKYMGKQSYKINVTANSGLSSGRAYQDVGNAVLVPGSTYTLSGYVKATSLDTTAANTGAALAVTFFDANNASTGTKFSDYIKSTTDTSINGGWRRLVLTFTVPSGTDFTRINLALRGATGTVYFDALQLEKYNNVNTYNMLENSSLDNYGSGALPTSWSGNDLTASDMKTTSSQNGAYAFKIVGSPDKNKELVQSVNISGNEGDTYIVSGWAKANAVPENDDKSRRFKISVRVVYSTGDPVWKQAAEFNRSISDWQFTSSAFTLDDGTTANRTPVRIDIYVRYHQQCNTAYFDNIQLIKDVSQSYTYDKDGNVITVQKDAEQKSKMEYSNSDLTKYIDAKGYAYTYDYDDKHNMTKATSQRGLTYNYTYDSNGMPTQLESLNPNKEAGLKSTITYTGNKAFVSKASDQDGNEASYTYDQNRGTLLSATDSYGTLNYTYNANNNRLQSVSKSLDDGTKVSNQYTYTSGTNRNLLEISHNGTTYSLNYDVYNNKTKTMVGTQTLATFAYGANNGLLQRQTYGTGQYVGFTYDAFGNIATQSYNGTTAFKWFADRTGAVTRHQDLLNKIQYDSDYDVTGRLVRQNAVSMDNNQNLFSLEYGYDANNNVSKLVNITSNKTARNAYVYGKDNLPEKYTIDNSRDVTYSYDSLNRLTKTSIATTAPLDMEYKYWKSNRAKNGTTEYKTTKISEENIAGEKLAYYYDDRGNITNIKTMTYNADGTEAGYRTNIATYEYDQLGQLVFEKNGTGSEQRTYSYDAGGNLLSEKFEVVSGGRVISTTTTNYAYGDSNWKDKLTSYDGKAITYDEIGNPLSYRNMTMTWQNGRQLATLQKGNTAVSYTYDANNVRASKTVNGEKYTYQYLDGKLIHETRGEKSFNYYYDANGYLTAIKYRLTPTGDEYSYYVTHNWRGDVIGIYSGSGVLTAKYEYDTWGNVKSVKDGSGNRITDQNNVGNLNPFRYRGYYYDTESKLYYLMSRYYDPVTHRFINADGYFQSGKGLLDTNMNVYCDNNPINSSDPTGEDNNCPIHKNHWFQSNCVHCRPEYQDQLDKEMKRGQEVWMPDGGINNGGTMVEDNGVEIKTDKVTYIPPDRVKDLYKITKNYKWEVFIKSVSVADFIFGTKASGAVLLMMSILNDVHSDVDYENLCKAIEIATENGNGLVIIDAPYCDDPRATAGKSWAFNQYEQWSGNYGEYPYAKNPFG